MPALVPSSAVEGVLRAALAARGHPVSCPRRHGGTGADIEAVRGDGRVLVEAIAFRSSPPARARDFHEAFFRAVSRAGGAGTRLVVALASRFGPGLRRRAAAIGPGWRRIGAAFPEIGIRPVDVELETVRQTRWNDWLEPDRAP